MKEDLQEQVVEFMYRVKHKDGKYRWLQTFGTVFNRDTNFKVEHLINVSIDVTQNFDLTRRLSSVIEKIRQKEQQHHRMINEGRLCYFIIG